MALINCTECGGKASDKEIRVNSLGNNTIDDIVDEILAECDQKRRARELRSPFPLVWNF